MRNSPGFTAAAIIFLVLESGVMGAIFLLTRQSDARESIERHQVPEMKFIKIRQGTFMMGSNNGEKNERPIHQVTISREFELQETEVTQAQWEVLMEKNPSAFRGADRPVESVSWEDCQEFINRLNARQDRYQYRLPTEAEWEYACRAGTTTEYAGDFGEMIIYDKNSGLSTHQVRSKRPNAWGLYDMHGNVWEWVQDWFDKYQGKQVVDPQGPHKGSLRVLRGGSPPDFRNSALGLRLARTAK
jgi:formylglycine-generating enzyme required for sulfatase activity